MFIFIFQEFVKYVEGFLKARKMTDHPVVRLPVSCISSSKGRGYFSLPSLDSSDKVAYGSHFFLACDKPPCGFAG